MAVLDIARSAGCMKGFATGVKEGGYRPTVREQNFQAEASSRGTNRIDLQCVIQYRFQRFYTSDMS